MAKEILLYNFIFDSTAQDIIERLDAAMDGPVDMRVNSGGGSVFASWGMFAKMQEHGDVNVKVDGIAASGAAMLCMYAKSVECLDVSRFMLHRADAPVDSAEQQTLLDSVNKDLYGKMKAKFDEAVFKEVAGISIHDMFEGEVKNVWLTAKQAKKIGLVQKINKVDPAQVKAINEFMYKVAAQIDPEKKIEKQTDTIMTLAELKAQHPGIYNEAVAIGLAQGIAQEKDRVEACLVFNDIDPKGVKAAIESGKPISGKQMAEFTLKATSAEGLKALAATNAPVIKTEAVDPTKATAEAKKNDAFMQEVFGVLGFGKKEAVVKTVVAE